ncbi:PepSY-associated TM helix domain-containing protein [Gordonia amicalis]|uniref:PepSY domain-containing protein n=1 Tax=Gordonia amicalis TaxID=89053 RepID=A0ABU4DCE1_9ACTN|nr:PepSY domain-containing protein [Gordonia amicalis]MDJ0454133.1 PepSY domain-containing protein [Gordonia amicalis]MDV6306781.1 PepSY domain-containing protein [Gordonia amicalis]MDV7077277.1 PepSY domain-containing protein [Gordonia amicalis]MDV7099101.1 PepSY domain-containing protein [Gordonia amicalis]MDV7173273.1 PepSY domain-containing protein [Gordonia amicalis]
MSDPPDTPETAGSPPARPSGWQPLLRRLHFYAGLFVAPLLVVVAITGGLYAIAPSLEQVVYRDQLHTSSSGDARPVAEQVGAAVRLRPDLTLSAVRPAASPGDTTRVLFDDPTLGESERQAVFIDPVTLESTGQLVSYGSAAALPLRAWLSGLHRNLHLGEPGRIYSELAASWLWVVALGGLALWISQARRRRSAEHFATFDAQATGRNRTRNRHGVIGVWLVVGLVFLSATGLTWSKYAGDNVAELRTALSWTTPTVVTAVGDHGDHHADHGAEPQPDASSMIDELDRVLDAARAAGVDDAVEVTLPSDAGTAFTVTETRQPWQFTPDSVAVDGATAHIVDESRFGDWPLAAQLTNWGIALHMGILFGWINQLVLLLLSIALLALIIRGYQMWWQRRPRRSGRLAVGRPPVRGALLRLPAPSATAVIVIAVAIGWFLPLLGLSLTVFVLVDAVISRWPRRRADIPTGEQLTVPQVL